MGQNKARRFKKFKKTYLKKGTTAGTVWRVAKKAYQIAKGIAETINSEKKFHDEYVVATTINNAAPTVAQLLDIDEGTADQDRNGGTVSLKSLSIHGSMIWDYADITKGTMVRVMIVLWKDDLDHTAPALGDVLQDVSSIQKQMISPYNMDNRNSFVVLYDNLMIQKETENQIAFNYFNSFKNKKDKNGNNTKPLHVEFDGTNGTDFTRNQIFLVAVSNQDTHMPTINMIARSRFYDN